MVPNFTGNRMNGARDREDVIATALSSVWAMIVSVHVKWSRNVIDDFVSCDHLQCAVCGCVCSSSHSTTRPLGHSATLPLCVFALAVARGALQKLTVSLSLSSRSI